MRRALLVLISVGFLAVALSACGSEEATAPLARTDVGEPATQAEPTCVPRGAGHARICALAPPQREVPGGTAYKATTITGESFWVVIPSELAGSADVMVVPGVPIRVQVGLTTASARGAADRYCDDFPACEPVVVSREELPGGSVLTRWDDASGTIRDLEVTTLDLGSWTLVMSEPDAARAERVARALRWSVDEDGYPRLASTDPDVPVDADWASVNLWVPTPSGEHILIDVIPGCDFSAKDPDLGGSEDFGPELQPHQYGGRWCVGDRYWVDVSFVERSRLELWHEKLRIVPATSPA
jgi:hypothetical protein